MVHIEGRPNLDRASLTGEGVALAMRVSWLAIPHSKSLTRMQSVVGSVPADRSCQSFSGHPNLAGTN